MNRVILILSIIMFMFSCSGEMTTRNYKSPVKFTGGFNDFELNLDKSGQLELLIETSIAIGENEAGTTWEIKQKRVTGNWTEKNEKIKCSFNEPKDSIDKVFDKSSFQFMREKELIRFSAKLDTAFIYGIPCLEIGKDEN